MDFTVRFFIGSFLLLLCVWNIQSINGVEETTQTTNLTKIFQAKTEPSTENKTVSLIQETPQKPEPAKKPFQAEPRSIDIEKYVSQEFHNQNNVYQLPASPDTEKFIHKDYDYHATSQQSEFNYHTELTTPKSIIFDRKYKEAVDSVDQKLEHIDDSHELAESKEDLNLDDIVEKTKSNDTKSDFHYLSFKNIIKNDTAGKNDLHKDLILEAGTNLNFQSSYNKTTIIDEIDNKNNTIQREEPEASTISNTIPIRGDYETLDSSTVKSIIVTTRKNIVLTKPPSTRNSSDTSILSNNIETETFKAINPATTEQSKIEQVSTSKRPNEITQRGSVKFSDYARVASTELSPLENIIDKKSEQIQQENKLVLVHLEAPTHVKTSTEDLTVTAALATAETKTETTESYIETITKFIQEATTNSIEQDTTTNVVYTETADTLQPEITTIETTESAPVFTTAAALTQTYVTSTDSETTTTIETSTVPTVLESITLKPKTSIEDTTTPSFARTSKQFIFTETISTTQTVSTELPRTMEVSTTEILTTILPTTEIQTTEVATTEIPTTEVVTTEILTTEVATTEIPTTEVATTEISTTEVATTEIPTTKVFTSDIPIRTSLRSVTTSKAPDTVVTTLHEDLSTINVTPTFPVDTESTTKQVVNFRNINVTPSTVKETEIDTTDSSEATSDSLGVNPDNDGPGNNGGTIAAIVISCVAAVCLVLLAGLLFVMRKRQKRFNYGQRCTPISLDDYSMDNASVNNSARRKGLMRSSKRSYGNPAFEDPVSVSHPLNFPALGKFAANLEDIKAEFDDIPVITARTNELPEGCDTKNRYANVIPLPETRVFLRAIEGYPNSDYINANYVTGPKNTKGYYIACQAPLQNTVDDFWRMLWEQQCKVVLMLTHFFENGVEKCVDYLPPSEVLDCHRLFGDFQVTLKKREVKDKYIISIVQLKNMVSNSWREITHFWYLGWPEKGVPNEANSLIAFLIEARSYMKSSSIDRKDVTNGDLTTGANKNEINPVVVHCSPGTGRTGVVIACDIAIREFEQTRLVDVPRIVSKIRRDRASAVQTKEQFAFIYKVISLYATKLTGGVLDSL